MPIRTVALFAEYNCGFWMAHIFFRSLSLKAPMRQLTVLLFVPFIIGHMTRA